MPHINMNPPRAYTCSPSWTPLPSSSPYHPSRSSQCTSPKDSVSNLDWQFISYMILYMFPCLPPGDLPEPGIKHTSFLTTEPLKEHLISLVVVFWSLSHVWSCNPMDCSPPASSVHRIFQARILEWIAISFSRGCSWPSNWTWVSCIAGSFFTDWATRETLIYILQ